MLRLLLAAMTVIVASSTAYSAGPFQGPVQGPVSVAVTAAMPVVCDRPITYKHHHPRREPCGARQEVVLLVKDPCTCCYVRVPVCIPCCCDGEPKVCCHPGILCRDVAEYSWCCGYRVKIVIDRHGCVVVHYNV